MRIAVGSDHGSQVGTDRPGRSVANPAQGVRHGETRAQDQDEEHERVGDLLGGDGREPSGPDRPPSRPHWPWGDATLRVALRPRGPGTPCGQARPQHHGRQGRKGRQDEHEVHVARARIRRLHASASR